MAVAFMVSGVGAYLLATGAAAAQTTIRVETLPVADSTERRSPFSMAPPDMQAANRLIGCYEVIVGRWSTVSGRGDEIPIPSRVDLLSDRHTRIYIGFGLVARTPGFSAEQKEFPPAWSPIGEDSLQVRVWANGSSSVMLFLRRRLRNDVTGTVRYFGDMRSVDAAGRWLWETYPAAAVWLLPTRCA